MVLQVQQAAAAGSSLAERERFASTTSLHLLLRADSPPDPILAGSPIGRKEGLHVGRHSATRQGTLLGAISHDLARAPSISRELPCAPLIWRDLARSPCAGAVPLPRTDMPGEGTLHNTSAAGGALTIALEQPVSSVGRWLYVVVHCADLRDDLVHYDILMQVIAC